MRIAVVADTHDRVPAGLIHAIREADEIWHLGDVCSPRIADEFLVLGRPLRIVRGNNDYLGFDWPLSLTFDRDGTRFQLVHIPPRRPPPDVDVLLHGHTHEPCDVRRLGVRWLNPGALFHPRGGTTRGFGWLDTSGPDPTWTRVELADEA